MVGPRMHQCSICSGFFHTRATLDQHRATHADMEPSEVFCEICHWPFLDSMALENHKLMAGHSTALLHCDTCDDMFQSQAAYNRHRKFPAACSDAMKGKKKSSSHALERKPPVPAPEASKQLQSKMQSGYVDVDAPKPEPSVLRYDRSATPSEVEGIYCHSCRRSFESQAGYDRHALWCSALLTTNDMEDDKVVPNSEGPILRGPKPQPNWSFAEASKPETSPSADLLMVPMDRAQQTLVLPVQRGSLNQERSALVPPGNSTSIVKYDVPPSSTSSVRTPSDAGVFVCKVAGCGKTFRTEKGLRSHKADAHGIGGKPLDIQGRESWMLNQQTRELLKHQGLLHSPAPVQQPRRQRPTPPSRGSVHATAVTHIPKSASAPMGQSVGGWAELEQAKLIYDKIIRLLIQTDVCIQHDGKIICSGIAWTRIGVQKQVDVAGMFDKLAHLPAELQRTEYLPSPKAFKDEYKVDYPATEFMYTPERVPDKLGLSVIAISCIKVMLADGLQEAVGIAVVDLLSCQILMNHLICSNPNASVKDWRTNFTGLSSFRDLEAARQSGFKVFKGWQAVRVALWKFIDKETIIVGYNLRSDLDALRMIHGRAVDIAKVVEKAANGPFSKQQLSLESLCRDYPQVHLTTHPKFGRDCLQNAFAVREFGLWALKESEGLAKKAKQMSMDYQRVMGI